MKFLRDVLVSVLLWASAASASVATYCPATGVCYSIGIPPSTVSAGSGNIYIQITAPLSGYSWAGIGIGAQMAGAIIFVMYTDGNGNVTLSARDGGQGHVMPSFSSTYQGETTLLAGSGVSDGIMTANFAYSVSSSVLSVTSSSTNWISAWRTGDSLDSTSTSLTIAQHDVGSSAAYAQFSLDLTKATTSSDSNPFVSTSSTSNSTTTASGSGSTPTSSTSSAIIVTVNEAPKYMTAHGLIMAISMVILFPFGAIFLRVIGHVWIHAAIQVFTFFAVIAGFGLGIHLAQLQSLLFNTTHTVLGTVVVCLFLLQPFLGLLHHHQYRKIGRRSFVSHAHIWYGRVLIILGIINGGLGLQLANNAYNCEIAYGVVAGIIFVAYVAIILITGLRRERAIKGAA